MPGWEVLGQFATALPALAQAGASIYAASRQPRSVVQMAPVTASAPYGFSPYTPMSSLVAGGYPSALPTRALAPLGGAIARGGGSIARGILLKASSYLGRRVTAKQAVALARRVGVEAAAVALGISAVELLQLVATSTMVTRRRRGITGRQIANARSTIRRMTSFMTRVQEACAPAMRRSSSRRAHRAGCACFACRRAS